MNAMVNRVNILVQHSRQLLSLPADENGELGEFATGGNDDN